MARIVKVGSPSERKIAKYLMVNSSDLSTETAASLAVRLKLSPMTVGRFLRGVGYQELAELIYALNNTTPVNDNSKEPIRLINTSEKLIMNTYAMQNDALQTALRFTNEKSWTGAVEALGHSKNVIITSGIRAYGLAHHFFSKLSEIRIGVAYVQCEYAPVKLVENKAENSLLVIVDSENDAIAQRQLEALANRCEAPVLILTANSRRWNNIGSNTIILGSDDNVGNLSPMQLLATVEYMLVFLNNSVPMDLQQRTGRLDELRRAMAQ